jgi:bacterioferritin (cytochrome b1)
MKRKGFYFKKGNDGSLYLNIQKTDFIKYLEDLEASDDWVKFRIFERKEKDEKGHTHNMELIQQSIKKDT